ncbi:MAG: hypothetical protein PGN30_22610 [Mycolicibacterium neoaurum]|uniref:hypothetical protein n=1 Tax=Mycolicibacterium neoaurum TaxID=1795 RepID=UPI002FF5363D
MEIINLPSSSLDGDGFGSRGIAMCSISGFDADVTCRVHIAWCVNPTVCWDATALDDTNSSQS